MEVMHEGVKWCKKETIMVDIMRKMPHITKPFDFLAEITVLCKKLWCRGYIQLQHKINEIINKKNALLLCWPAFVLLKSNYQAYLKYKCRESAIGQRYTFIYLNRGI